MKNWHFGIYDDRDDFNDGSESCLAAKIRKHGEEIERYRNIREAENARDLKNKTPVEKGTIVTKSCEHCGSKHKSHINNRLMRCKTCIDETDPLTYQAKRDRMSRVRA